MNRLMTACMLIIVALAAVIAQEEAARISLADLQKLHAAGKVLVVDVRDPDSFASGHIAGAINVPLGEQEQAAHFKRLTSEKRPIVTYCA